MEGPGLQYTDLQPEDERTALVQRLDRYRQDAASALTDLGWKKASVRLLPATDLTIAGIVKHLAWAEDRCIRAQEGGCAGPRQALAPTA